MRLVFLFVLLGFITLQKASSQDTIVLKNTAKIVASILNVNTNEVQYTPYGKDNQTITLNNIYIKYIQYADGTKLDFGSNSDSPVAKDSKLAYMDGQKDAVKYYTGYRPAATGTLVVSLLSPLVGLVPAIVCSVTPPKEKNLEYPSTELYLNPDYNHGYNKEAKKMKSRKVWRNWGIAFAVNIVLTIALSN